MAGMASMSNLGGPGGYSQQPMPSAPPMLGPNGQVDGVFTSMPNWGVAPGWSPGALDQAMGQRPPSGNSLGGPGGYQQNPMPSVSITPPNQMPQMPMQPFPSMYGMPRPGPMPGNVMGPNPSVSIPSMYGAQQALVGSGMYSGQQPSQMSPDFLKALSMAGLSGFGGSTNPSQGNGSGGQAPYQGGGSGNASGGAQGGGGGQGGYGGSSSGMGQGGYGGSGPGSGGPSGMGYGGGPNSGFGSYSTGRQGGSTWSDGTIFDQSVNYGSMGGLRAAENGRLIGSAFGALTGIPGMGSIGNYLGNQYIDNNVFQSPAFGQGANLIGEQLPAAPPPSEFNQNLENMVNPNGATDLSNSSQGFTRRVNSGRDAAANNRGNATYGVGSWSDATMDFRKRFSRFGGK